ncbi:MAG: hypothetical protein ACFB10_22715 [Salibacteraceae bacterium]
MYTNARKSLIVESSGFLLNHFPVPQFKLQQGEVIGLNIGAGAHFFQLEKEIVHRLTGEIKCSGVHLHQRMAYAEPLLERWYHRMFLSQKIKNYWLEQTGSKLHKQHPVLSALQIEADLPIERLNWSQRKWLSLFAHFEQTTTVIFNLQGLGPRAADQTMLKVRDFVDCGKAAFLIDSFDDQAQNCDRFYSLEMFQQPSFKREPALSLVS